MSTNLRYDYYTVNVPSDCENDPDRRFDIAIMEAREHARLYVVPCQWRLISDNGDNIVICRVRNNPNK